MNGAMSKADPSVDGVQQKLVAYAESLTYERLPAKTILDAKIRIVDTLGALIGGFFDEPCVIARTMAADVPVVGGATIFGTGYRTTPDLAAFVNSTTSRSVEMNDVAHRHGGRNGHPSDVIAPILGVGEFVHASGRDVLTAVVLAYEVYLRLAESISTPAFDAANFCCLGTAIASGRLLGLDGKQLAQCISMAVIPNNALNQTRTGQLSMWKAVASGQSSRSGVFAALLARRGMEGPNQPFEGKHGWCNHVGKTALTLPTWGGGEVPFRIGDTVIKPRAACFHTLSPILSAEKAAAQLGARLGEVSNVKVEVYRASERTMSNVGSGNNAAGNPWWNPESRETADHSIPYCVAAALFDGTVTKASFDDAHLSNGELRALLSKVDIVENDEFTAGYDGWPVRHRTRVSVTLVGGARIVGDCGGDYGDLGDSKSEAEISAKFRALAENALGAWQVDRILEQLWRFEDIPDVSVLPPMLVLEGMG